MSKRKQHLVPRTLKRPRGTLSLHEAAERLNVHPQTLRRWVRKGEIKATGGGGAPYYIEPAALEEFLTQWEVR